MTLPAYFSHDPIFSLADVPFIVDEFFGPERPHPPRHVRGDRNQVTSLWRPKMDLHEDTQTNVVTATFELPGLAKENLQIDADVVNHRLTISGEYNISEDKEDKTKGFTVRERQYGKFARTLPLPHGVEAEEVKAALKDGVLTVTFPKATSEQGPKRVNIE